VSLQVKLLLRIGHSGGASLQVSECPRCQSIIKCRIFFLKMICAIAHKAEMAGGRNRIELMSKGVKRKTLQWPQHEEEEAVAQGRNFEEFLEVGTKTEGKFSWGC
jgi:hypothetical protein